jgi:hypothetical protein
MADKGVQNSGPIGQFFRDLREDPAKVSLILGAFSLGGILLCIFQLLLWPLSFVAAVGAIVFGVRGLKSAKRRQAIAGIVCGSLSLVLNAVLVVCVIRIGMGFARQ